MSKWIASRSVYRAVATGWACRHATTATIIALLMTVTELLAASASADARSSSVQSIMTRDAVRVIELEDPTATPEDLFGSNVSLDGDTLVVGAYGANGAKGIVYVYNRNQGGTGSWGRVATLHDPAETDLDCFGDSVSVNGDTIVVGAAGVGLQPGAAYVYSRNQGGVENWGLVTALSNPTPASDDHFGNSVATNGDTIIVAVAGFRENQEAAYIYSKNHGGPEAWGLSKMLKDPTDKIQTQFGSSLAVSGDTLVIGAALSQQAYVYGRNVGGTENWGLDATLVGPTSDSELVGDGFGGKLAVSGSTIVVAAEFADYYQGAAYIYRRDHSGAGGWELERRLHDPVKATFDEFGDTVAVDGDTVVVGSAGTHSQQGVAYLYRRLPDDSHSWPRVKTLNGPPTASAENFGSSVAVDGRTLIVGADATDGYQGKVYIYELVKSP